MLCLLFWHIFGLSTHNTDKKAENWTKGNTTSCLQHLERAQITKENILDLVCKHIDSTNLLK